ncbi:hypothetical protein DFJ73DRAFT_866321, partial [Zopfochytrium polystomum]
MKELQEDLSPVISLAGRDGAAAGVYKATGGRYEEQRRVTAVLYLTDHHAKGSGGDIKLFRPLGSQSVVETRQGRLLLFLSGRRGPRSSSRLSADRAAIS